MRSAGHLRPLAVRALELLLATAIVGFVLFLPFAGRFFDDPDPLEKADLILVLAGSRVERWLEAVDLYNERWAPRLVISPGMVARIEPQLRARGIKFPREGDIVRDAVLSMGLPPDAVTVLPEGVDNTAHEAAALQRMLPAGQISRIIVVTSPYHTRRVGFAFRRAFAGTHVRVIVRSTRYSDAEPARWWRHRADIRDLLSEMPKYAAYVAGLAE
jgi:uncharacterized SAM-binding protein YcdF (DUF218 family)